MDKKAILNEFYQEVWVKGNIEAISQYLQETTKANGIIPEFALDSSDHHEFIQMMLNLFNDLQISIRFGIEQDDWLSAVVEFKATSKVNANPITSYCQILARFEDNKIAEVYVTIDFLALFEQIGRVPSNSHVMLLTGTTLK